MTDEEARKVAHRTWAVIQKSPELKLLVEWLKEHPNGARELLPIFDCIGCNIELFETIVQ